MTPSHFQHDWVHRQLERLDRRLLDRDLAADPELRDELRIALADAMQEGDAPRSEYYSHHPVVSIAQSALHEGLRRRFGHDAIEYDEERMGDPFTDGDLAGWVGKIALSLFESLSRRPHPFNDAPARAPLEANARLVLLSDWGTGRKRALDVAAATKPFIAADRPVHVIHLGDTYYSGTHTEAREHLLEPWPVTAGQANTVRSWALNGNHDMYSGGHGLFETTLADARFTAQRAARSPTSWFQLAGEHWNVLGLDTAYCSPPVELLSGRLALMGQVGHLHGSQAELVGRLVRDHQRLLVLSHHQLFSAYGDTAGVDVPLWTTLRREVPDLEIDAWIWGHEHDCLAYRPFQGVQAARAIGNGGVPMVALDGPAEPIDPPRLYRPIAPPDLEPAHPLHAVDWEYRDYRVGRDGRHWSKHGFAVVDFDEHRLHVRYIDDAGECFRSEDL